MSRHEIEIEGQFAEGLLEEYEIVKAATPKKGDKILTIQAVGPPLIKVWTCTQDHDDQICLIVRRKVRKYDHSKTLDDVLVMRKGASGCYPHSNILKDSIRCIAPVWQPNIHGKCPVDGEACIVRVRFADGTRHEGIAAKFTWVLDGEFDDIIAWQFIRLADGVEW